MDEPLHIYNPKFKYTSAKDSAVEHDYLRKKFKKLIAQEKAKQAAKQEAERQAAENANKGVLRLRRQG